MSNQDREQAMLKAGAQLNGLEWPRITLLDEDDLDMKPGTIHIMSHGEAPWVWLKPANPLAAMCNHVDAPGLTERLPELNIAPEMREWADSIAPEPTLFNTRLTREQLRAWAASVRINFDTVAKPAALVAETSTALPAPAGVFAMASTTHKLGGWGA